ncbi:Oidioi.mRNA.OKI2018_I69.chr1.g479.t1.cds [Oikopleura dioica]|uniref:Oidioi.mRNA.OKI2018_I69.chr1.g479.t1.cds n=1 Tax=Oikopleura dioica TaxID=34765 RepID=A0ABN7SJZ2_OIKDI|nr:Oidioi.mRNA.OKI2018_I69.chr1.g479.t1.cds [Oikopleura dioica]
MVAYGGENTWIRPGELLDEYRVGQYETRLSAKNVENSFRQLFGFPKILGSFKKEALLELKRRENVLSTLANQTTLARETRLLPKRERSRNGRRSSIWRDTSLAMGRFLGSRRGSWAPSRSRSRSKDELFYISENENDNEKTKRLKREMRGAQDDLNRLPVLEEVTEEAENDDEVDKELVDQAKKMIEVLNEKKNLRAAISKKEIKELEEVLERIEKKGWVRRLQEDYNEGQKLLARLRTYEKMRHEIMALTQPTISEIRSYQYPPKQVESVMRATYILLGEKPADISDWRALQALIGKLGAKSLKNRATKFDFDSLPKERAQKAHKLIKSMNVDEVRDVSNGAATFFVWSQAAIEPHLD